MLAPRVIAPHVNKHIDNLKGHEALGSLLYGNKYGLEWYWRAGSGSMADVAMQKGKERMRHGLHLTGAGRRPRLFMITLMDRVDAWMSFFRLRNLLKSKPHRR